MNRKSISIKWKIFLYMLLFVAVLLVVLWLFQTVFLDSFYKRIKMNQIKGIASSLAVNIDSEDFITKASDLAYDNGTCILVASRVGEVFFSAEGTFNCVIHKMSQISLINLIRLADSNDGSYLHRLEFSAVPDMIKMENDTYVRERMPVSISNTNSMIFVKRVTTKEDQTLYVVLNSNIAPVEATVDTIRIQLLYITVVLVLLALILAMLISRKISKPIEKTNQSAKELAMGNYDVKFDTKGYKEIDELNDTLNTAAYELSRVEGLRRELLANVSHDLRTPLTMITGFAEVIRDIPGENTPENAQVIVDEANRLNRLVTDLLDLSKLQAGANTISKNKVDLTKEIKNVVSRITQLLGEDRIRFSYDKEALIQANETQVTQVIYNLITNAVTYSEGEVYVRQRMCDGMVRIEVEDSGPGISEEDLPYIWERYYKVDKTHKRSNLGSGLGLSIIKQVMTKHDGKFGVTSIAGKGSTFFVEFPLPK